MATEREFHELIGRAFADTEFRDTMAEDPQAAAKTLGFELSSEQLDQLKHTDLKGLSAELEMRASKKVW